MTSSQMQHANAKIMVDSFQTAFAYIPEYFIKLYMHYFMHIILQEEIFLCVFHISSSKVLFMPSVLG